MESILSLFDGYLLPHWPFVAAMAVFTIIGHFMSYKVFTRPRSRETHSGHWYSKFVGWFWYWGRESLSLHPIAVGAALGLLWSNPESAAPSWPWIAGVAYFAGAGVVSLFAWSFIRGYLKKKGIELSLPGDDPKKK